MKQKQPKRWTGILWGYWDPDPLKDENDFDRIAFTKYKGLPKPGHVLVRVRVTITPLRKQVRHG